ncbi:MAG: cytochrome c-type biogenesis protein CcmH [Caldilineaceae bacterium]|nr:cytochrome c-type biogenesis protein CcmH [Caldilineaceae bacterium]
MSDHQESRQNAQGRFVVFVLPAVLVLAAVILAWIGRGLAFNLNSERTPQASFAIDQQMIRIADKLQCPVCEGQSVAFSNSQLATEMRRMITEKLEAGESESQIMDYFVERYGVKILRRPPGNGLNAWLWITPVVVFVIAAIWLTWTLWRISQRRSALQTTSEAPPLDENVRSLLAQYDEELFSQ